MKRGEMYRVYRGSRNDPKYHRVFVIISRQILIDSQFSTVICAPVYSNYQELSTQVRIGSEHGMKHECAIHCDELVSIPKNKLTDFISSLPTAKINEMDIALRIALDIEE